MKTKEVVQKGKSFKAKMIVTKNDYDEYDTKTSPEFVINGAVKFQVRHTDVAGWLDSDEFEVYDLLFVRFTNLRPSDDPNYMIYFNSVKLNIVNMSFTSGDGKWHLIYENKKFPQMSYEYDVAVDLHSMPCTSSFASLHEDTELTDIELRAEDGSVRMHRAVLAAASPELSWTLGGAWCETFEGHVVNSGISKATLEHLKSYVYLQTLPESGLEQLLLLSSYYKMPELKQRCVDRLVHNVNAANACDLIELAAKNNVKSLLLAILGCVQNGVISVTEMRDHQENNYNRKPK